MNKNKLSNNGLELIKKHEGLRLKTYDDGVGILTIGYGSTGDDVYWGLTITQEQAEKLLKEDVTWAEDVVNSVVLVDLNQNEFDALVSFVFNIGSEAFSNSTLLKYLNRNKRDDASNEFSRWIYGGGRKLDGLIVRRQKEQALFNTEPNKAFKFRIRAIQHTSLKKDTKDSSALSPNQKREIKKGEYLFVDNYDDAENGHYELELSFDAGTRYIFADHWSLSWDDNNESEPIKKKIEPQNNNEPLTIDDVDWNNFDSPVSKHFTVGEVVQWETRRIPKTDAVKTNVLRLASELDDLRKKWGSAIGVTSWYRPYDVNAEVGGVPNSQHLTGKAVDIYPYKGDGVEFEQWLDKKSWRNKALGYGQRSNRGFSHCDLRGRVRWYY